ncbi:hypothetical protein NBRC10512_005811 [Rhodotorula toruloides]|uniref:RHTO0S21e02102g1_1 n=2 Tax=Rhodotorula toruloides TaxID=5286 RepID=A0A061BG56_RHOTO|nr:transcription elongation regulator 1 [Rhodotorula toruloides NP11]EMS18760.1 transcription elongation regulator 1 [Rhodotorula toruloides NP11]CDR48940.1 RHTO0S21e02102g1_1 [Rhodotorula toruloides]
MSGAPPPPPPPGFPQAFLPPVPPPWTEHRAPNGTPYWFNPLTNVSTYTRPVPAPPPGFPIAGASIPPPPPGFPVAVPPAPSAPPAQFAPPIHFAAGADGAAGKKKEKKEKPKEKKTIEGTPWIRVTTNKGNVFYNNKETKESLWTVPDEIKEQAEALEKEEQEAKEREEREQREKEEAEAKSASPLSGKKRKAADEDEAENDEEEQEGSPAEEEKGDLDIEIEGAAEGSGLPSKPEEPTAPAPAADSQPPKKKKAKTKVVTSLEELDDEDWQRQMAAEMAKEAEDQEKQEQEAAAAPAAEAEKQKVEEQRAPKLEVDQVEAAALYKVLLSEKDINPMAPFETELPKFVNDPRYHSVKSQRDRRDLFDEFCKEKIREQRAAKKRAAESGQKVDPLTAYRQLLATVVTSTRTHFSDFKRSHQKDQRYRDFGKTEGDREKEFKRYLRELGERKREAAEKAEREFREMLSEDRQIKPGDKWADVKKRHANDSRYTAVNSSSLREQLFNKHVSAFASGSSSAPSGSTNSGKPAPSKEDKAARAAASLREREERVRQEKMRAERNTNLARGNLGKEEAEREFGQLLVDAVRDHKARFDDLASSMSRDPRFDAPSLTPLDKRRLFDSHQAKLYRSRIADVESLFAAHSPKITTPFHDVLPSISSDPHVTRLVGDDFDQLEKLYDSWIASRTKQAREDFTQMLKENSILEHWGRLKKMEKREDVKMIGEEGVREDSEDEEPDVKAMAEQVDLRAIHAVLKNDKRYLEFNHVPEERARWVEEYVENLAAPKTTVHQRD